MTTSDQDQLIFINGWPKLAVLFVAFALGGIVVGILGMVALSFDLGAVQSFLSDLFFLCWLCAVASLVGYAVRCAIGSYRELKPKPWNEQKW
jgi:hypothetical protein